MKLLLLCLIILGAFCEEPFRTAKPMKFGKEVFQSSFEQPDEIVNEGEEFDVELPYSASTGYKWGCETENLVLLEETRPVTFVPPATNIPGGSGSMIFYFKGTGKGIETINFYLKRGKKGPIAKTLDLDVQIE